VKKQEWGKAWALELGSAPGLGSALELALESSTQWVNSELCSFLRR
jgi:hypothetical protein